MRPTGTREPEYRTKVTGKRLCIMRGPAEAGPQARAEDEVVGAVRTDRLLEAVGEAIAETIRNGAEVELVNAVNGGSQRLRMRPAELEEKRRQLETVKDTIAAIQKTLATTDHAEVQQLLRDQISRKQRDLSRLEDLLALEGRAARRPKPHDPAELGQMCAVLQDVILKREASQALDRILEEPERVDVGDLTVRFETHLMLGSPGPEAARVGPISISVENVKRLGEGEREAALVKLCLEKAWPVRVVAAGIPLISGVFGREKLAAAFGRRLEPQVGKKAASVLGGCEVPEALAVVSRELGFGEPEIQVEAKLAKRITDTYITAPPVGHNSWKAVGDSSPLVAKLRELHQDGRAAADLPARQAPHWERREWLKRDGDQYARQTCPCGSTDLALIPTPEPKGLVCLNCRQDRCGLVIPASWNVAICDKGYWEARGYDLAVPPIPGLPVRHLNLEPLSYHSA